MRLIVALLTVACLAACGGAQQSQSQSELTLMRNDDQARQRQAVLNAEAILRGMAQARQRQAEMARSAR